MNKKTILITGANGQLGREMQVVAEKYPEYHFIAVTREQLPIDNQAAVERFFNEHQIDVCVNCAAYTAVDKAESEIENSNNINGYAVGNLATICEQKAIQLIHISTDYVFDGTATEPYEVNHPVKPVNQYGASKLLGEQLAIKNNPSCIIIRTSWVYSTDGNNFVKTMMRLMKERNNLNVVADQQGCPTYAADLANAIMEIVPQLSLKKNLMDYSENIFHYSNSGVTNWHEFAVAIKKNIGSACEVNPIPTSAYPTPAKRPAYSVMNTQKISDRFKISIPTWQESLKTCIEKLLSNS
jgi:dTDP-4-dehydrorhamnose reductase